MSYINMEFPLLVESIERQYHVQPLLFSGINCQHKRYANAIDKFRKALRKQYKNAELDQHNIDEILWHGFNPDVHLDFREFDIRFNKQFFHGRFAVVFYQLKQLRYACFPKLSHKTIILPEQREDLEDLLFSTVQNYFKQLAKEEVEGLQLVDYESPKTASVTLFTTSINIPAAAFSFEDEFPNFFEMLQEHQQLRGEHELAKVGRDFNEDYPDALADAYLRQELAESLSDMLYQAHPTCLALIGPRGSGKHTLIQAAVKYYLQHQHCSFQRKQKLWFLDPLRVISGMSIVGMWQRRMEAIINHIRTRLMTNYKINKTDHLYIDNIIALFRIGKSAQNNLTLADVLKPYMEKRAFTIVVKATPEEWQKAQAFDRKFTDLFEIIRVDAAKPKIAMDMIIAQRLALEKSFNCQFNTESIVTLWQLRHHFANGEVLPGSIVRVMKQTASRSQDKIIDKQTIFADYKTSHKFRERIFNPEISLTNQQIHTELDEQLVGQALAKTSLVNAIQVIKAHLAAPQKPLASLLFIGPTGVGKTEAAKVLTRFLFEDEKQLVRFDMNEYVDSYAPARLIGDHVRPEGQLTSQVRFRKTCVLLLDEIEKAHPLVHDLLLQVLGEGRLTDALGRTTDFTQCIVIMTSNLGAQQAVHQMGFSRHQNDQTQTYIQAVKRFFRPEFLNRIDEQVIFESLSLSQAMDLTQQQIRKLLARNGFTRRTMFFNVNAKTLEMITQTGFDPDMGGRALKRNIERSLTALSADQLVTLQPEKPVLLEIYQQQQQLLPHLTALDYEQPAGMTIKTVAEAELDHAVLHLFSEIEQLEVTLNEYIDQADQPLRIEYWGVKERLLDLKNTMSSICWDVNNWHQTHNRQNHFQIKQKTRLNNDWRWDKSGAYEVHAKQDLADYFQDIYHSAWELRDLTNNFMLQQQQEYDYIQLIFQSISAQPERIGIVITPLIESYQQKSDFFLKQYQNLLSHLLIHEQEHFTHHGHHFLIANGHGLYQFLAAENGIHLLQQPQLLPFHIKVGLLEPKQAIQDFIYRNAILDQPPPQRPNLGNIIRLYTPTQASGSILMTDFRTGLMCYDNFSIEDWKLLLLSRLASNHYE